MSPTEQRHRALKQANRTRYYRARVKADIAEGRLNPDEVLVSDHPLVQTMPVGVLLGAVPGMGPQRMRVMLARGAVSAARELGRLTPRERGFLLRELRQFRASSKRWRDKLESAS